MYFEKINSLYHRLKHKDVFTLIQKHNLYGVIHDMLIDLMELDDKQTIALLLEKNTISTDKIVEKLKPTKIHLYKVCNRIAFYFNQ